MNTKTKTQTQLDLPMTLEQTLSALQSIERARTTLKRANISEETRTALLAQLDAKERALDTHGQKP